MIVWARHLLTLIIFLGLWFFPHYKLKAVPTTYYASPTGTGSVCTIGTPCLVNSAWALLVAGDTLILNDGTYTGNNSMIKPPNGTSGSSCGSVYGGSAGNLITVKAAHDGLAIIDGQLGREPGTIRCIEYMRFEGLRLQNSNGYVVRLIRSSHNEFVRVSAHNAFFHLQASDSCGSPPPYDNFHVFALETNSNNNLLDEVILSGSGRDLLNVFVNSNYNILRDIYMVGGGYTQSTAISGGCSTANSSNHGEAMQLYSASFNVVENFVAIGIGNWTGHQRPLQAGANIWANTPASSRASGNAYQNGIIMNYPTQAMYVSSVCNGGETDSDNCIDGALLSNITIYKSGIALHARNGRNVVVNRLTLLNSGQGEGSGYSPKADLYVTERNDTDHSSTFTFNGLLVANGQYGCYGEPAFGLQAADIPFFDSVFYNHSSGDFFSTCASAPKTNVTQGINPALTSLVYVAPTSPAYTLGPSGGPAGADLRCKYHSTFNGDGTIQSTLTTDSWWPLSTTLNDRIKSETLSILGTAWDVNAKVLDELGPRNLSELACPGSVTPPDLPPIDSVHYASTQETPQNPTSTVHLQTIDADADFFGVCVGLWDAQGNVGSVTDVTSSGEALSLIGAISTGTVPSLTAFRRVELWGKLSPTTGSRSIVVNTMGAVDGMLTTSFFKADVLSLNTVLTGNGLGQTPSLTPLTASDENVIDCLASTKTSTTQVGPDQTQQSQVDHTTQSLRLSISEQFGSAGANMSWSNGQNAYYAHVAVSLSPQDPIPPIGYTRTVTAYRIEGLGDMNAPTVNDAGVVTTTGSARMRFQVTAGGSDDVPASGYQLYCKLNGGSYVRVMDDFGSNVFRLTTNRFGAANPVALSPTFPFLTDPADFTTGFFILNESDVAVMGILPTGNATELLWMIDVNATKGDVIRCRPHLDTGAALTNPDTVVSVLNVINPAGNFGQ